MKRLARAAWMTTLVAAVELLTRLDARLPAPPLLRPGVLGGWLDGHDPSLALVGSLRVCTLGFAWYLLGVTTLGLLARLTGLPGALRAIDHVTLAPLRPLVHMWLGATLTLGAAVGPAVPAAAQADDWPPVLRRLADDKAPPPGPAQAPTAEAPAPDPPVEPAPIGPSPTTTTVVPAPAPALASPTTSPPPTTAPPRRLLHPSAPRPRTPRPAPVAVPVVGETWTVARGESFWSIARSVIGTRTGRTPTNAEIAAFWRPLVGANTGRLARRGNADLLFAGQVIAVPP
jgi:hypothetical protein